MKQASYTRGNIDKHSLHYDGESSKKMTKEHESPGFAKMLIELE